MRLFIAIDIPDNIKNTLFIIQTKLKSCNLEAKWVTPKNLHVTLKFLGEVEEKVIPELIKIIDEVNVKFTPFTVKLKEFGFFPNPRRPQVFFISTDQELKLKNIALLLEEKLESLGIKKEGKFKAHITIARIKSPKNIGCLIKGIETLSLNAAFSLEQIALIKSTLKSCGPIYERIK